MANNYLQFSEELAIRPAEVPWFEYLLDALNDEDVVEPSHDKFGGGRVDTAFEAVRTWPAWDGVLDFQHEVRDDAVWFYSEESGEPYLVGLVVQQYFKTFFRPRSRPIFTLTWASYCDKMRIGEFSGGGMVVTRDEIVIRTHDEWMDDLLRSKRKRNT